MAQKYVLPRCGTGGPDIRWANQLVNTLQHALDQLGQVVQTGIVVASDVVPPVTFDPATATTTQTAQAFATLLTALQKSGVVQ